MKNLSYKTRGGILALNFLCWEAQFYQMRLLNGNYMKITMQHGLLV